MTAFSTYFRGGRRLVSNALLVHRHRGIQLLSTAADGLPNVSLSHPTVVVWGSNTGVGKTLISTGLAASSVVCDSSSKFTYIKPVQTGFPTDSDSRFLYRKVSQLFLRRKLGTELFASNHVMKASGAACREVLVEECESGRGLRDLGFYEERKLVGVETGAKSELVCKTMYAWNEAISPHLAVEREGGDVRDSALLEMLGKCLRSILREKNDECGMDRVLSVVETAGGVASPGPSGSLQCDLYRPFRLPAVLVGDGRLGGISGTISAYETLRLRGYDVVAIVVEDRGLANEVSLKSYLRNRVPVLVLPPIPQDLSDDLIQWFDESQDVFTLLRELIVSGFSDRNQRLHVMPKKAKDIIWWPFTQHKLVPEEKVTVIDSRCGENFAVFKAQSEDTITHQFDACASWWTQGPDMVLQTELARDMGYTVARYGHVMFPENIHEPALECAELLLQGVGEGWASRAYFSDNGSTAIEIALKMAFRKFYVDHKCVIDDMERNSSGNSINFKVLALNGSYHGDTLGAMEAQAPSSYTGFLQQPWYTGRGIFLNPSTVSLSDDVWELSLPNEMLSENVERENMCFSSRDLIFHRSRDSTSLAKIYETYITNELQPSQNRELTQIGALIIEPVIQAAGGMQMIDPLFQRILVNECRQRKIPVIFDEVFTGFWRLGVESTVQLLGCLPDIACYAKLMTGGIIPLAATLTTDAIFDAFIGDSKLFNIPKIPEYSCVFQVILLSKINVVNYGDEKLKALLHGHSYTAHAMGCAAACKAIKWFKDPSTNLNIISNGRSLRELWDTNLVSQISSHPSVERVVTLGTLFALELQVDDNNAGYASLHASSLLMKLCEDGIYMRPLGNVIYLMCGPCTSPEICNQLLMKLYARLEEFNQIK
ncbi:unnamed protein product [Rhodiola kirilowii]